MKDVLDTLPWWSIWVVVGVGALILLVAMKTLFGGRAKPPAKAASNLVENLADYPPAPAGTLDFRLLIDKIPVRLRLVALAPIGDVNVNLDDAEEILDRLAPRLGDVARQDKPRVKIWPRQVSGSGFAQQFFSNAVTPEGDGEQSTWILVAGRAKIGKRALMVGLAVQSKTPTSLGQKTLDVHEWPAILQVRVRE